jgi:hypothetical protein
VLPLWILSSAPTIPNVLITEYPSVDYIISVNAGSGLTVVNPQVPVANPAIHGATGYVNEDYAFDLSIVNTGGFLLDGVVVDCEDQFGTPSWTAGTVETGAVVTGAIEEQIIRHRRWYGASETLTEYSPHKFTFTKAGYETLIVYADIDSIQNWQMKLKGPAGFTRGDDSFYQDDS